MNVKVGSYIKVLKNHAYGTREPIGTILKISKIGSHRESVFIKDDIIKDNLKFITNSSVNDGSWYWHVPFCFDEGMIQLVDLSIFEELGD